MAELLKIYILTSIETQIYLALRSSRAYLFHLRASNDIILQNMLSNNGYSTLDITYMVILTHR